MVLGCGVRATRLAAGGYESALRLVPLRFGNDAITTTLTDQVESLPGSCPGPSGDKTDGSGALLRRPEPFSGR
jgi:hypothetical protein